MVHSAEAVAAIDFRSVIRNRHFTSQTRRATTKYALKAMWCTTVGPDLEGLK